MIDSQHIGRALPSTVFEVEKGRLRFFAEATGETRPEYLDESAAKAAGYRSLPAPPTFLMAAELDSGNMFGLIESLGVPLDNILHGEQSFTYHGAVCAGDILQVSTRLADIYSKKGGALEFIVLETVFTDQNGSKVQEARCVFVARDPRKKSA